MEASIINSFPGYEFVIDENNKPHNMYRGVDVGFGGYIYAEPGMYRNVAVLDSASHHPTSIICMNCFGEYTKNYKDLLDARIAIKHGKIDKVKTMLGGKLTRYISDDSSVSNLAYALKIALNSTYGLTSAGFDNPFRDKRNKNNIVALRGALFLKTLHDAVVEQGFSVIACKTDSIKIPDATPEIIKFVQDFGKKYGYTFEHEETYERMCLVNAADFIARIKDGKHVGEWTATGAQFQVPYVFKKLFSKEEVVFDDLCVTKSVKTALYLDMNEGLDESEHNYRFVGKVGRFCPIKEGCGGGILLRETVSEIGEKGYAAVVGTKGYRWLESEMVRELGKEADIDYSYFDKLVDAAVTAISKYGDFERFVSDEPIIKEEIQPAPPCPIPCGDAKYKTCFDCEKFCNDDFDMDCGLGYDVSHVILKDGKANKNQRRMKNVI